MSNKDDNKTAQSNSAGPDLYLKIDTVSLFMYNFFLLYLSVLFSEGLR